MRVHCFPVLLVLFLILLTSGFVVLGNTQEESTVKIISAHRTQKFVQTTLDTLVVQEPEKDVILVLKIGGISIEEFRGISDKKQVYITVSERRFNPDVTMSSTRDGKPWTVLLFSMPKEIMSMEFVFGDYAPIKFNVKKEISEEIRAFDIKE